jgi:ribonuclease T1
LIYLPEITSSMKINVARLRSLIILLLVLLLPPAVFAREYGGMAAISQDALPAEARATLILIKQGGPFPYDKDGMVFGNYEVRLPRQKRGYYHEYTVKTPRARNRGAKRIIAGGNPGTSGEYYFTDDHYESFKKIQE